MGGIWQARKHHVVLLCGALALGGCRERDPSTTNVSRSAPRGPVVAVDPAPRASGASPGTGGGLAPDASGRDSLVPERTVGVIVGVLSFADPGLRPFPTADRKDVELYELLVARGVPRANLTLLLDGAGTTRAIREAVRTQAARAPAGATFVFYYAGHGVRDAEGNPYLASYDLSTREPTRTGLAPSAIADDLRTAYRGRSVWVLGDFCYSGALAGAARSLAEAGWAAASLTSAEAANTSANSWTFTQTVIDALSGEPLADRNHDGAIALSELGEEVADAMKFREKQRSGFYRPASTADWLLARASGLARAGGGRYVLAPFGGGARPARVLEAGPTDSLVRFYSYATRDDRRLPNAELENIEFRRHAPNASVQVYWGGKLWPAQILRADGDFHWITYPGWPSYWNEWVLSDRIVDDAAAPSAAVARAQAVSVEWHGTWYPATVLAVRGARYLIHYDGYDADWDEWVDATRLRAR